MSEVTFHDLAPLAASPGRYHAWPERDEQTICQAFLRGFTSPDGQVIMDELYRLQQQLPSTHELRQSLGIVFPYLIDTMRRGQAWQDQGTVTRPAEPLPPF